MDYQKGHYSGPKKIADAVAREADTRVKVGLSHLENVGEELYRDNFKGIEEIIKSLKSNIRGLIPQIKNDITDIINNKVQNEEIIEELLDSLLNFMYMGLGKEEFKELNQYYSTVNKEFSKEYEGFYNEIFRDEI